VLDRRDQLPFGPHSDVVGWEESVEDLQSQWRWKFEVLQREADGTGSLTADVALSTPAESRLQPAARWI
jgi:hypothetical protein